MRFFVLFSLLISDNVIGQIVADQASQDRKTQYQIDFKYKAGDYLIFNCERKHYACVNLDGFQNCTEERRRALSNKATNLSCAPLKKFNDKKLCVEKNYQLVDINAIKRFCYPK